MTTGNHISISPIVSLFALVVPIAYHAKADDTNRIQATVGKPTIFSVPVPKGGIAWAPGYDQAKCPVVRLFSDDAATASFLAIPDEAGEFHLIFWSPNVKGYQRYVISASGGTNPAPGPKPKPDPKPEPKPDDPVKKVSKVSVVFVEESSVRTPAEAATMSDPALRKWLTEKGHSVETVDKDDPAAAAAGYGPYFQKHGHITVLVFDSEATGPQVPLVVTKLPSTPAAVRAAVEKVTK